MPVETLKESLKRERKVPELRLGIRQAMSVPMCDPGQRLSEEQDYVQAYENVREKYKGNNTTCRSSLVASSEHTRMMTMARLNERFGVSERKCQ